MAIVPLLGTSATAVELVYKQHIRDLEALFSQHLEAAGRSVGADRRHVNAFAIKDLEDAEGRGRFELGEQFDELHRREFGARRLVLERASRAATRRSTTLQIGLNKQSKLERTFDERAAADEERFRLDGLRLLAAERADEDQKRLRVEARREQMRADMEGFTAVKAFVESDQTRQRAALDKEEAAAVAGISRAFAAELGTVEVRAREREQAEIKARLVTNSAAADAARREQERKEAETQRQQQRLISKCTHSRAGKSVFVGSYAKKMCLMCKVKLDPRSGLYVQM